MNKQNETINFTELVVAARRGDAKSMDKLIRCTEPRLRAYICRSAFDLESVDDLVQETLLKLIKSLHMLKKPECFWSWLFRIAGNVIKDCLHQRRRLTVILVSALQNRATEQDLQYDYDEFADDTVREELNTLIKQSISRLEARLRNIVYMRCFYHMSYLQISSSLGFSAGRARLLFFTAKQKIRRDLENRMSLFHEVK